MIRKYQNTIIRVVTIIILLILQIAFVVMLPYWLKENALIVYIIIEVLSVILLFSLIADDANAAYRIFWLGVVLLFPISGHLMYELWGKEGAKRTQHREIQETIDYYKRKKEPDKKLQKSICDMGIQRGKISNYLLNDGFPAYKNTEMEYIELGERTFKRLIDDLEGAHKFIFLSFFTIADGMVWERISNLLAQKAGEGVEVKVMYDDAGTIFQLSDHTIKKLKKQNIEFRKFNAIEKNIKRQYFQYRNHQKIVIIDGNISYTGGINISDRYANINSPYGHWKDVAIRLYGEGTWGMTLIFLGMWDKEKHLVDINKYKPSVKLETEEICQPYADGPANNPSNPARDMYHMLAGLAENELLIMTPYLIIDDETKESLCMAAKSGVSVKIITPGIPDKKRTKRVTEWHYGSLLKAGVQIYEYKPGFVHAKLCMNDTSGFIGTVNMDFRSFYLHYECGVWFSNSKVMEQIRNDFYETLEACKEITIEAWEKRPFFIKVQQLLLLSFKSQL